MVRSKRQAALERLEERQLYAAVPAAAPAGSAKLAGTVIGTAGSYRNQGNTVTNAFDGRTATYYDGAAANGNWAGLDLGGPQVVTQVQFLPRSGYAGRMIGGVFQASTAADFSAGVTNLFTVTAAPSTSAFTTVAVNAGGAFEYVRYLSPAGSSRRRGGGRVRRGRARGRADGDAGHAGHAGCRRVGHRHRPHLGGGPDRGDRNLHRPAAGPVRRDVRHDRHHDRAGLRRHCGGRLDGVRISGDSRQRRRRFAAVDRSRGDDVHRSRRHDAGRDAHADARRDPPRPRPSP